MSENENLDALIERVLAKAHEEAETMTERAEKAAGRELGQAEEQARMRLDAAEAVAREAVRDRLRAVKADARQTERRELMNAREDAVQAVFTDALRGMAVVEDRVARRDLLVRLVGEGIRALATERVNVRLNAAEQALVRELGFPAEIDGALVAIDDLTVEVSGGPIVTDAEGRIVFENTFEARLDRVRDALRRKVARMLGLC
jgi:vacuolar-type H+-ATPase subunit E/Vma4